jgi:hypothetical protein
MMAYSDQIKSIQALGKKELYESPIHSQIIMKKIALTMLSFSLFLSIGISVNLEEASAQNTSIPYDMQAIKNGIGDSLSKLTGTNSSNLLSKTMILINETASRLANETSDITNAGSLQQAEIIGKKIAIGIADVLGNISGEVKQGFEIK